MGWYDLSIVRLQSGHKVRLQGGPQGVLHGVESFQMYSGRGNMGQEGSGWFQLKFKGCT